MPNVLTTDTLPYLDSLLDAIVARETANAESAVVTLHEMVPGLQRGTARRLVNLKFGNPQPADMLTA